MTIKAWWLLKKLKKAQTCMDGYIAIDYDTMEAIALHTADQKPHPVSIKLYKNSIHSLLAYLEELGFVSDEGNDVYKVTCTGWFSLSADIAAVVKTVLVNILIPIAVSVVAAILTTLLMKSS